MASGHDEDWRKLADRMDAIDGEIWHFGDPVTRGTGFASQGVDLLSHIPLNQFGGVQASGNDCWGYTSPSGREYAIMGVQRGFGFVEITDPVNPVILTTITGPDSLWHDVKVVGTYAYGVSEGGSGIQVMDLSDIDNGNVTLVRNWQGSGHSTTHNIITNPETGSLWLAGANVGNGGLVHLDLSDPTRPAIDGGWTNMYVHDAQVVTWHGGPFDGREIAFLASGLEGGFTSTGLRIADVTNPNAPQTLATLFYSNAGYSHQCWLSDDRQYLYLNDELDEDFGLVGTTTTRVIDISDLTSPVAVDTFTTGLGSIDHNLYTRDGFIFQANYRSGLRIFDGGDPLNPIQIGFFDTFPGSDSAAFNGAWSVYPFFESGTVIVSDIERGLFILGVPALTEPRLLISADGVVPAVLDPAGGASLGVEIIARNTSLVPSSVELVVTDADGTEIVPGTAGGGGGYSFVFPPVACGGATFYVRAESTDGQVFSLPSAGAAGPFEAAVISEVVEVFADNFQTNMGWTVSGDAADGQWDRGVPVNAGRGDPSADGDGSGSCYLTDNSGANNGNSDVDDGTTILTSPVVDLSGGVRVEYEYWLNDVSGGSLNGDALVVEISTNGGLSWTEVRRFEDAAGSWRSDVIEIDAAAGSSNGRVRFSASDLGTQNVVEAGIDGFVVNRVSCDDAPPACPVDLAPPFGVLDLADVQVFVTGFLANDSVADLAAPFGVFDLNDLQAFVNGFVAGCP